jgi:hypothetical protein
MGSAAAYPVSSGDPGAARRAAIALAITMPWLGLPVGWIFMMIEDSRKQAVGRVCAVWSMIALVFHFLLMFAMAGTVLGPLREALMFYLKAAGENRMGGGADPNGGLDGGMGGGRFGGGARIP